VTSIGTNAFDMCPKLMSVTCLAEVPPTFGAYNFNASTSATLYVPAGSVDAYKATAGWNSKFGGGIFPIP
jgi:hypothetical protein